MGLDVSPTPCADLTDVTLADEDRNSTPADDVNLAILGNASGATWWPKLKLMQVATLGDQTCN